MLKINPIRGKINSLCIVAGVVWKIENPELLIRFGGCDKLMISFLSPPCNEMNRTLSDLVLELSLVSLPAP